MINKKYLKNLRSKEINKKNDFIFDLYNERIIDSLDIINLKFKKILILGNHGSKITQFIDKKYKNNSLKIYDLSLNSFDLDYWEAEKESFDLVISNFYLFLCDDLNNVLRKIINSLASNGFFIATMPTQENFNSLKEAMIKTDIEVYGGAYNRFNKFFNLEEIIKLLKKNNFKIPLVNSENIELEYSKFENLLSDLRSMKLSYYNEDKKQKFENKNYFVKLEKNFKKNSRHNYQISTNFYILSAWKDHHSQQKPLKPGQAKNSLKEFLK